MSVKFYFFLFSENFESRRRRGSYEPQSGYRTIELALVADEGFMERYSILRLTPSMLDSCRMMTFFFQN